jgi:membrane protein DedA with SNARE-associated domain/membrane-associated phospholipid phosphatase
MPDIASGILGLHGFAALAVVFAMPALESSAFVGFVFPGEIAVVLGGVLAFNHRVNLYAVIAAAVAGAVIGDSIGYAVGRRWGNRLLEGPLSRFIRADHAERAKQYLVKRGGRAVFLGRFTAALRVMVPGLAGMSGVPYGRFAISNMLGGTVWAIAFVLLGYGAGASWRTVAKTARNASLLLLGVIIVVVMVVGVARWVSHHPEQIRARLRWVGRLPGVRWARRRFDRQLSWLARRVRPSGALGLSLTAGFAATLLLGTGFAVLANIVAGPGTQRHVDRPVLDWLVQHRSPTFTQAMKVVTALASTPIVLPLVAVGGLVLWAASRRSIPRRTEGAGAWRAGSRGAAFRGAGTAGVADRGSRGPRRAGTAGGGTWGSPRAALTLAAAFGGAWALSGLMKSLVARPRPPVAVRLVATSSWSFPSGHATQAIAFYGCAAALTAATTNRWSTKATVWAGAVLVIVAIGFSRLYLGVHWVTDVLGGYALGAVWLGLLLIVIRAFSELRSRSGPPTGSPGPRGLPELPGPPGLGSSSPPAGRDEGPPAARPSHPGGDTSRPQPPTPVAPPRRSR